MKGIRDEIVVERVFANPQGIGGESCWVRNQVMQEETSPKSDQNSLWSAKEKKEHKWASLRKNSI